MKTGGAPVLAASQTTPFALRRGILGAFSFKQIRFTWKIQEDSCTEEKSTKTELRTSGGPLHWR